MKPIIRIGLLKSGYGHQFFLSSWNPVVRAHAVIANFKGLNFTIHRLALAIHRDSIEACEVNEAVARIYADFIKSGQLTAKEKMIVRTEIQKEVDRIDTAAFRSAGTKLLRMLGLLPSLGVVSGQNGH